MIYHSDEKSLCTRCTNGRNCINGRWCTIHARYVEYARTTDCAQYIARP